MNYNELKKICLDNKNNIENIANLLGMTYNGLKRAIENETLPIKKVKELCAILEITPNDFFGTSSVNGNGNIVGNIVGDNSKVIGGMVGSCPLCAEKDKEISALKDKIISLQEKLIEK